MSDAYWFEMMRVFGPPGEPAPVPRSLLMVGGPYNGERREFPKDLHMVRVPVPQKMRYLFAEPDKVPPLTQSFEIAEYEWRKFQPCWSAQPIRVLVERETSDELATLLYQEWS